METLKQFTFEGEDFITDGYHIASVVFLRECLTFLRQRCKNSFKCKSALEFADRVFSYNEFFDRLIPGAFPHYAKVLAEHTYKVDDMCIYILLGVEGCDFCDDVAKLDRLNSRVLRIRSELEK